MSEVFDPANLPKLGGRWSDARNGSHEKKGNLFLELVGRVKVLLDGDDVSNRCFYFDEDNGIVGLHALNEKGKKYAFQDGIATEWRRGKVDILIMEERKRRPIDTRGF